MNIKHQIKRITGYQSAKYKETRENFAKNDNRSEKGKFCGGGNKYSIKNVSHQCDGNDISRYQNTLYFNSIRFTL